MWKRRMLCLILVLSAVLLTACQQQETFPNQPRSGESVPAETAAVTVQSESQSLFGNTTVTATDYDNGSYDPASEEGGDEEEIPMTAQESVLTPAPTMKSEYAGATPVLIDPVDKPTATPLPTLNFGFIAYEAPMLHMTFEGPSGWMAEETSSDTFTLTNPDPSMDYAAQLVIRAVPVAKQYNKTELTREITGALDTIKGSGFKRFDPSKTAGRVFLNSDGIYANYNGTLESGVKVGGRIIAACVDKTLYILHVSFPQGYREYYIQNVYDKFRHSVKLGGTTAAN